MYTENIEKIFMEEIREKKRTGNGSFHKRGKGVKHGMNGALKTPYHYMKEKDRKKLSGEVETYNMNEILSLQEFSEKDVETQKMLLTHWREEFPNSEIKKEMGMSNKPYYDLVEALDLPKKTRGGSRPNTGNRKAKIKTEVKENQKTEIKKEIEKEIEPPKIFHGLNLDYQGDYTAEQLSKILTKLQLITEGEENIFEVFISFKEKVKNH